MSLVKALAPVAPSSKASVATGLHSCCQPSFAESSSNVQWVLLTYSCLKSPSGTAESMLTSRGAINCMQGDHHRAAPCSTLVTQHTRRTRCFLRAPWPKLVAFPLPRSMACPACLVSLGIAYLPAPPCASLQPACQPFQATIQAPRGASRSCALSACQDLTPCTTLLATHIPKCVWAQRVLCTCYLGALLTCCTASCKLCICPANVDRQRLSIAMRLLLHCT